MPETPTPDLQLPEVLINGRFLVQRVTGVQRYAREALQSLDELLATGAGGFARWTLLTPAGAEAPPLQRIRVETVGRMKGHAWEQIELAWRARRGLLFSFALTGPALLRRQIITVHDAAVVRVPQAYNWRFRLWYRLLIGRIVKAAPRIVAVSRFSSREAVECFDAPAARMRVSTEGWQHLDRVTPDESVLDRHGLRGRPFALAVSSPTPSKNFSVVSRTLALLGPDAPRFAIAGNADPAIFLGPGRESGPALRLGFVSDAELKALYLHATCFVMPSLYEGFGIPPLEAMACGCPVIASTAAALQEVCGDAALYFDPQDPRALADRLLQLFADASLAQRMSQAGVRRAASYSWKECARLNLDFIQEAQC